MATADRSNAKREPRAQKPGTDRNDKLAALAASSRATDETPAPAVKLPTHSGRVRDLGGAVKAVVITPWAIIEGNILFRGDHVLAKVELIDETDSLVRL